MPSRPFLVYISGLSIFLFILSILQRNLLHFQLQNLELLETSVVSVWMKENWNKMGKRNAGTFKVGWADTLVHASAFWIGSESERVGTIWLQFAEGIH